MLRKLAMVVAILLPVDAEAGQARDAEEATQIMAEVRATPTGQSWESALPAGKDTYCQKPLCLAVDAVDEEALLLLLCDLAADLENLTYREVCLLFMLEEYFLAEEQRDRRMSCSPFRPPPIYVY